MREAAGAGSLRAVSANPPIEVICEISSLEEPIRGRLRNEAGRTAEFRGWMEFSNALMSVAAGTEQTNPTVHKEDER